MQRICCRYLPFLDISFLEQPQNEGRYLSLNDRQLLFSYTNVYKQDHYLKYAVSMLFITCKSFYAARKDPARWDTIYARYFTSFVAMRVAAFPRIGI